MYFNKRLLAVLVVFGISLTAFLWFRSPRTESASGGPAGSGTMAKPATGEPQTAHSLERSVGREASPTTPQSGSPAGKENSSDQTGPLVTKPRLRDATTDKGGRRAIVDPLSTWSETPPWPEGPRLFAEVDTPARKYINLRPNDIGVMPLVQVESKDPLTVTLSLPEATPGEKIYLELPNGGEFPDIEGMGRICASDQFVSNH